MKLTMPTPRSVATLGVITQGRTLATVLVGNESLVFHNGVLIALCTRQTVYYPDSGLEPATIRVVNKLAADPYRMLQRTQAANFDFIVAQQLISTAMPWTNLPEEPRT